MGRTETALRSCIGEPAQTSVLAELRQSVSSSLNALNQKVEAVQNVRNMIPFRRTQPNDFDRQLAHINTQALQTIKDQQLQILTAIIPLLPTLQKVPLHIASAEANLKEAIRKSAAAAPPIPNAQPTSTGSTSGSRKRKPYENTDQYTPSPSVTKRKRMRIDSGCTPQQQLPSPKSSRDTLLARGGLPTANHHHSIGDALHTSSRPAPVSIDIAQTRIPVQRLSIQPPTSRELPTTPSQRQSTFLSDRHGRPASSTSHRRESTSNASVTPFLARSVSSAHLTTTVPSHYPDHSKGAFRMPTQFCNPLHTGPRHLNSQVTGPSAPPLSSVGFSAVRYPFYLCLPC